MVGLTVWPATKEASSTPAMAPRRESLRHRQPQTNWIVRTHLQNSTLEVLRQANLVDRIVAAGCCYAPLSPVSVDLHDSLFSVVVNQTDQVTSLKADANECLVPEIVWTTGSPGEQSSEPKDGKRGSGTWDSGGSPSVASMECVEFPLNGCWMNERSA